MSTLKDCWIFKVYSKKENKRVEVAGGIISNDSRFKDGSIITTSPLKEIGSDYIITRSGTRYDVDGDITVQKEPKYMLLRKGGKAIHKLGDISRNVLDAELIMIHDEDENNWIGEFAEGFGFIDIKFNKSDCRNATEEELCLFYDDREDEIMW